MNIYPLRQGGFTLLEIIVGIGLSLGVLTAVISIYVPTLQSYRATGDLSDLQDNQSLLHTIFGTSIRQAGLLGCDGTNNIVDGIEPDTNTAVIAGVNNLDRAAVQWAFPNLAGGTTHPAFLRIPFLAFPANISDSALNTAISGLAEVRLTDDGNGVGDIFYTLAPSTGFNRVAASTNGVGAKTISFQNNSTIVNAGDFYIINDCDNTVLIRADQNSATGLLSYNNNQLNNFTHAVNTVVTRFEPSVYYLRVPGAADGVPQLPSLYRRSIVNARVDATAFAINDAPIITGVDNMRIEYGLATDTIGNGVNYVTRYVTANNLGGAAMNNVKSVRVTLMLRANQTSPLGAQIAQLVFPTLATTPAITESNCYGTSPDPFACPNFVISTAQSIARTVVTFTYQLPRVTNIPSTIAQPPTPP